MLHRMDNISLTREEEKDLLVKYKNSKDEKALERLITCCFPTILNQAYKFSNFNVELEDLIQEGLIGLLDAIRRFNIDEGVRLLSYARLLIRHKMMIYTAKFHISVDLSPAIRIASFRDNNFKKINSLKNVPVENLKELESVYSPEEIYYKKERREIILNLINECLDGTQREIIFRRKLTDDPATLVKVGKELSKCGERVRQIEVKSLDILRERIELIKDLRSLVIND